MNAQEERHAVLDIFFLPYDAIRLQKRGKQADQKFRYDGKSTRMQGKSRSISSQATAFANSCLAMSCVYASKARFAPPIKNNNPNGISINGVAATIAFCF